jgi:hypothetical protein
MASFAGAPVNFTTTVAARKRPNLRNPTAAVWGVAVGTILKDLVNHFLAFRQKGGSHSPILTCVTLGLTLLPWRVGHRVELRSLKHMRCHSLYCTKARHDIEVIPRETDKTDRCND